MAIRIWLGMAVFGVVLATGASAQGTVDPAEFEKVQAEMNRRIEELEAELRASREESQAREARYQQQIGELQQKAQPPEAAAPTSAEPAGGGDGLPEWTVRRVPAAAEPQEKFTDLFEPEEQTNAQDEVSVADLDVPVEVTDVAPAGQRRLKNRRDEMVRRRALQFTVRNLTESSLAVSAWAHQPGGMGWQMDEFGTTRFTIPAKATITEKLIPYDAGMDLYLMINGKAHTFTVGSK